MKILCLSTYPVDEPRHGGQHRLANIIAMFRRDGQEVCTAGVLGSASYKTSAHFADYPGLSALTKVIGDPTLMEDWAMGKLFAESPEYFISLADRIPQAPEVIYVEQPWLSGFATRFNEERCNGKAVILYGSQNLEHRLKYSIVEQYLGRARATEASELVRECEVQAIRSAMQVFCVSQHDLDWTKTYASRLPILAANGVVDRTASLADVAAASNVTQGRKFALYCGSAHPPNIVGFFDMFGNGAGCIPPEARMLVAGGVGPFIAQHERLNSAGSLSRQLINAGEVSEEVLRGLLATAHLVVLPITSGGGTNLKTAEALWSGQHIVATPTAMRGFEQFNTSTGVAIANDPPTFCSAIRQAFMSPKLSITAEQRSGRRSVLWENTLSTLANTIRDMELVS